MGISSDSAICKMADNGFFLFFSFCSFRTHIPLPYTLSPAHQEKRKTAARPVGVFVPPQRRSVSPHGSPKATRSVTQADVNSIPLTATTPENHSTSSAAIQHQPVAKSVSSVPPPSLPISSSHSTVKDSFSNVPLPKSPPPLSIMSPPLYQVFAEIGFI